MYRKNNAIPIAGKTRQVRGTRSDGKNEAENIVKFPILMKQLLKTTLLQISIKSSNSKNF